MTFHSQQQPGSHLESSSLHPLVNESNPRINSKICHEVTLRSFTREKPLVACPVTDVSLHAVCGGELRKLLLQSAQSVGLSISIRHHHRESGSNGLCPPNGRLLEISNPHFMESRNTEFDYFSVGIRLESQHNERDGILSESDAIPNAAH